MTTYGHFDNQKLGNTESDISFLNGILTAFQFINHKTDSGFDFSLKAYEKKSDNNLHDSLQIIYETVSEIKLSKIDELKVKEILKKWLFSFIPGINKFPRQAFLVDKYDHFSHSDPSYRNEFVEEFVYSLIKAINPINIHRIDYLTTKFYVANDNDILCFETQDKVFLLSCSWYD